MADNDKKQKLVLVFLAVFLLVIFSVTGAMAQFFSEIFTGGPDAVAILTINGEEESITQADYRDARYYLGVEQRLPFFMAATQGLDSEKVVSWAALRKVADNHGIEVSDQELRDYLTQLLRAYNSDYEPIWRSLRFQTARAFEATLRQILRINRLKSTMATAAAPTSDEVLDWWAQRYQEFNLDYTVWRADDFADAAAEETPPDEVLAAYFENGLSPAQRRDLELDETVDFEILQVTADALGTNRVREWLPDEQPSEEALKGFYEFHRFEQYMRPLPEEGQEVDPSQEPTLSIAELGDRLERDYRVYTAAQEILARAGEAGEDVTGLSKQMGLNYVRYPNTPRETLRTMPIIGSLKLDDMFRAPEGEWLPEPILGDGFAFIARPLKVTGRKMPTLDEVRDRVLAYWREQRAYELAQEAAQDFVDGLPRPEGYIEGDPVTLDAEAFAAAAGEAGRKVEELGWISVLPRPTVDPAWPVSEKVLPWLRSAVGSQIETYLAEQVIGPLEHPTEKLLVIGRLAATRPADKSRIWPGELEQARRAAQSEAVRRFVDDHFSFEGLSAAYDIRFAASDEEDAGN